MEWQTADDFDDTKLEHDLISSAANRVAISQAFPSDGLDRSQVRAFRTMLAEGMARALEGSSVDANAMLDSAQEFITARTTELARSWCRRAAINTVGGVLVAVPAVWWALTHLVPPQPLFSKVAVALVGGALGALMSILSTGAIRGSSSAGKKIHAEEGAARVLGGTIAAAFAVACVEAHLLLPQADTITAIGVLGFVAGWSERFLPALLERASMAFVDGEGKPKPELPQKE